MCKEESDELWAKVGKKEELPPSQKKDDIFVRVDRVNEKTARTVTLKEFADWIRANNHLTWNWGDTGSFSSLVKEGKEKGSPIIKYIVPTIDTRLMTIYHIEINPGSKCWPMEVDFREEFDGSILDLLSHKIKTKREEYAKRD